MPRKHQTQSCHFLQEKLYYARNYILNPLKVSVPRRSKFGRRSAFTQHRSSKGHILSKESLADYFSVDSIKNLDNPPHGWCIQQTRCRMGLVQEQWNSRPQPLIGFWPSYQCQTRTKCSNDQPFPACPGAHLTNLEKWRNTVSTFRSTS